MFIMLVKIRKKIVGNSKRMPRLLATNTYNDKERFSRLIGLVALKRACWLVSGTWVVDRTQLTWS